MRTILSLVQTLNQSLFANKSINDVVVRSSGLGELLVSAIGSQRSQEATPSIIITTKDLKAIVPRALLVEWH